MVRKITVFCFGEMLSDTLSAVSASGGAIMNIAYHLNRVGINTRLISRVGFDEPGIKLLETLHSWQLSTTLCQFDTNFATGVVHTLTGEDKAITYDIPYPVAWDHIAYQEEFRSLVSNADALVFGSLVTRGAGSRKTLFTLLEKATYRIFDLNLRPPHYSPDIIEKLLFKTDLLKLNVAELHLVASWFNPSCTSDAECIKLLQDQFRIQEVLVTRGLEGNSYFTPHVRLDYAAYKEDAHTVCTGNAFLAGFLAKKLQNSGTGTPISFASALGAVVTLRHGA
jgi:fructokinase